MRICKTLKKKNHGLVHGILGYICTSEKYSIIKNQAWAIEKQPVERGKHEVHFRCFFIKCWNRNATGDKTNPMKSLSACDSSYSNTKLIQEIHIRKILKGVPGTTKSFNNFRIGGSFFPQKGGWLKPWPRHYW